ncbi:MAG: TonB-dependent receptor, partial [Chitinophagaceae bacterium]
MTRNNFSWDARLSNKATNVLSVNLLYSDLFYETPGALTLNEFNSNPRVARPATPAFPSAGQARASIDQQALLVGLSNTHRFAGGLKNSTTLYGFLSTTKNPTVQNYERKREPHAGARTLFEYEVKRNQSTFQLAGGAEFQQGSFKYKTYRNIAGKPDTLRIHDELDIQQGFVFGQVTWKYRQLIATLGGSFNKMNLDFDRLNTQPSLSATKKFSGQFTPRFAVLYKVNRAISVYTNVAKGFSPPAADEIFADNNSLNLALEAEQGWNIEPGIRGSVLQKKISFDISFFSTGLENSIVTRRDSGGGNYFVNAGKTSQRGIEATLAYELAGKETSFFYGSTFRASFSHYDFTYKTFVQGSNDYSGNNMPGVAANNLTLMLNLETQNHFYLHLTHSYTDKIYLNDANSAAAPAFQLLSAKAGYNIQRSKTRWTIFAGADNIGDVKY